MDIMELITERYPIFTKSQKLVAAKISEDPMTIAFCSIEEAAEIIKVSTATIVRFSNALGLSGYTELQEMLKNHCQMRMNPLNRMLYAKDLQLETGDFLDNIYSLQIRNIQLTYTPELKRSLLEAWNYLKVAPHIYTCGSRGSYSVAYYLGHHLNRVFRNADIIEDNSRAPDYLLRIQPDDVFIAVNLPRYSSRVLQAAEIAKQRGAKVITITESTVSPYKPISDVILCAACRSSDFHNSSISAMLIAEILISFFIAKEDSIVGSRLSEMEDAFQKMDILTHL